MHAIIPPDALYGTVEKRNKFAYVDAADFNDSKVSSHIYIKNKIDLHFDLFTITQQTMR